MKKTSFLFIGLLLSFWTLGQEKKINFSKELTYKVESKDKAIPFSKVTSLSSAKGESLTMLELNGAPIMFYQDNLGMSPVSFGFNNQLQESWFSRYFSGMDYKKREDSKFKSEKLKTTETILGYNCQHYIIDFNAADKENINTRDDQRLKICLDEKNEINNFPILVKIIDQFSATKTNGNNLKGLILKMGDVKEYDNEALILQKIVPTEAYVHYDHQSALMSQQRKIDSLMVLYRDLESDYAALDSTRAVTDSAYASNYEWIPNYQSTYRKVAQDSQGLAIDNPTNNQMFSKIPAHCKDLKSNLPNFDNKELGKHLYNYVGQVCDMYLTQSEYNSVDEKITMDEIRREVLYLLDIKEKLNKSDQKKLDNYLKNLD